MWNLLPGSATGRTQKVVLRSRGRSRERALFSAHRDYRVFRDCLGRVMDAYGVRVHAYALLPERIYLLVTPGRNRALSLAIETLRRKYARRAEPGRGSQVARWWRFTAVSTRGQVVAAYRYVEGVPVRRGLVERAADWPYSSLGLHAYGEPDALVQEHSEYRSLGATAPERQAAYRVLLDKPLPRRTVNDLRKTGCFRLSGVGYSGRPAWP